MLKKSSSAARLWYVKVVEKAQPIVPLKINES